MRMKRKINLSVFVLVFLCCCLPWGSWAHADVVDRIVAIVNDDIITLVQLNREAGPYVKNIESSSYSDEKKQQMIKDLKRKILNALIDQSLTHQEAGRYHINVSDNEISNAVENVRKNKGMSKEEFKAALAAEGLTLDEYRENVKKQILQARLINFAVKSKVVVTESDIKAYYDAHKDRYAGEKRYHLRNILMDDESKIRGIKNKLDHGKKFATLAKRYSMASNASDGGDLGIFDIENFSESVKNSISKLKKGEYTPVISTDRGFQIFYVEDIIIKGRKTYKQAHDEIHEILYRKKVKDKFETWLEALKKRAAIKIML